MEGLKLPNLLDQEKNGGGGVFTDGAFDRNNMVLINFTHMCILGCVRVFIE